MFTIALCRQAKPELYVQGEGIGPQNNLLVLPTRILVAGVGITQVKNEMQRVEIQCGNIRLQEIH